MLSPNPADWPDATKRYLHRRVWDIVAKQHDGDVKSVVCWTYFGSIRPNGERVPFGAGWKLIATYLEEDSPRRADPDTTPALDT